MNLNSNGKLKVRQQLVLYPQRIFRARLRYGWYLYFHICYLCGGRMQITRNKNSHHIVHESCRKIFVRMKKRGLIKE